MTWHHHFFYRKESWKTTWKLKLSVLGLIVLGLVLTRTFLADNFAQSLVCKEDSPHSDALLLENFDPDYLVFERAEALRRAGVASRVFVPTDLGPYGEDGSVHKGFVDVMARIARLPDVEIIPFNEVEPISLNAAREIRDFLLREHIRSVVVVSPGFRSRRSELVYSMVLEPAGISVSCVPVFGTKTPTTWTRTWHGMEEVAQQFSKLLYYRLFVLR